MSDSGKELLGNARGAIRKLHQCCEDWALFLCPQILEESRSLNRWNCKLQKLAIART